MDSLKRKVTDIVVTILAVLGIRYCLVSAHMIPSESMEDTLLAGDFLLSTRLVYGFPIPYTDIFIPGFKKVNPGDIVIFKAPHNPTFDYVKRCVAGPGQTLEVKDKKLFIDGEAQEIPGKGKHIDSRLFPAGMQLRDNYGPVTVPAAGDSIAIHTDAAANILPLEYLASIIFQEHSMVNDDPFIIVKDRIVKKKTVVEVAKTVYLDSAKVEEMRRPVHHRDLEGLRQRIAYTRYRNPDKEIRVEEALYFNGKKLSGYRVKKDNYFMMGDNRDNSLDSRYWGFVNEQFVVASPFIIFWSWESDSRISDPSATANPLRNLITLVKTLATNIHNGGIIIKPRWTRLFRLI